MPKLHAGVFSALLGTALAVLSSHARADAKFELGLRTGFGFPFGRVYDREDATTGSYISDSTAPQVPLWIDLGARIGGRVFVGGYFGYGFGFVSSNLANDCDRDARTAEADGGNASCSVKNVRLGASVHYHFRRRPGAWHEPWLGAGFGYEWLSLGETYTLGGSSLDFTETFHGFELLNLQAGTDFPVSESVTLGPFIAVTFASYGTSKFSCDGDCAPLPSERSETIDDSALHHWFFLGVRGAFVL